MERLDIPIRCRNQPDERERENFRLNVPEPTMSMWDCQPDEAAEAMIHKIDSQNQQNHRR